MTEEFELAMSLLNDASVLLDPPPTSVMVVPGNQVAWDVNDGGLLWARISSITGHNVDDCCVDYLVITYNLGILRCVPAITEDGGAPPPDELTEHAMQVFEDQVMLRTAITAKLCSRTPPKLSTLRWTPLGPDGGTAGGEWAFDVRVML